MRPCTCSFLFVVFTLCVFLDYVIIGSDSGRVVILDYDPKTSSFVKVHQETFGKSGARRIVPGQYLATDPKGRSVMIAATEKAKLVYILNRDAAANLTISSPLEAHKNNAIIHHIVGLDVGFENPTFAALEVDYSESDQDPTGEAFNNAEKVRAQTFRYDASIQSPPQPRCSHITSSISALTTLCENGVNLRTLERTFSYKYPVGSSQHQTGLMAPLACLYAAKTTLSTVTWMHLNTVFPSPGGGIHWRTRIVG